MLVEPDGDGAAAEERPKRCCCGCCNGLLPPFARCLVSCSKSCCLSSSNCLSSCLSKSFYKRLDRQQEVWAGSGFRRTDEQLCYTDGYGDSEVAYGETAEDGLFFVANVRKSGQRGYVTRIYRWEELEDGAINEGELVKYRDLPSMKQPYGALAISGDVLAASNGSSLSLYSLTEGTLIAELEGEKHTKVIGALAMSGDLIVSGSRDSSVRLWSVRNQRSKRVLNGHGAAVNSVAISSAESVVVSGSDDATVKVWSIDASSLGECLATLQHEMPVYTVSVSGDTIASGSGDSLVRTWSLATLAQTRELVGHDGAVRAVRLAPGGVLVSGSGDGTAKVWELATNRCIGGWSGAGEAAIVVGLAVCEKLRFVACVSLTSFEAVKGSYHAPYRGNIEEEVRSVDFQGKLALWWQEESVVE